MLNICLGQQTKQKNIQPSYFVRALAISTYVSEKYKKMCFYLHATSTYVNLLWIKFSRIGPNSGKFQCFWSLYMTRVRFCDIFIFFCTEFYLFCLIMLIREFNEFHYYKHVIIKRTNFVTYLFFRLKITTNFCFTLVYILM